MSSATTTNAFAITLYWYHLYQRSRLKKELGLLHKIAAKYQAKSAELLKDLSKKYSFPLPEVVTLNELQRLIHLYEPPTPYMLQLPPMTMMDAAKAFDLRTDIYSELFDAEFVFANNQILAPIVNVPPLDNISRCLHLLPGYNVPKGYIVARCAAVKPSAPAQKSKQEASKHILLRIAENSSESYHFVDESTGSEIEKESPLALLFQCMQQKVRVRIILRRAEGIRGSMDGYIRAFDRHFNLLMTDVDEECITNKVPMCTPAPHTSSAFTFSSQYR